MQTEAKVRTKPGPEAKSLLKAGAEAAAKVQLRTQKLNLRKEKSITLHSIWSPSLSSAFVRSFCHEYRRRQGDRTQNADEK